MNIKYISLLSFFCVAGINAITVTEQLDAAKEALRKCQASKFRASCQREEERFERSTKEFVAPHNKKMDEGIVKNREIRTKPSTWKTSLPVLGKIEKEKREQEYKENYYETWGHGWIVEAFVGRSDYDFLSSDLSTTEFAKYVVDDRYHAGQSSYVEGMIGNGAILAASNPENKTLVKAAQDKVKLMIDQQAETPIQK